MRTSFQKYVAYFAISSTLVLSAHSVVLPGAFAENATSPSSSEVLTAGSPTPFHVFTIPPSDSISLNTPAPSVESLTPTPTNSTPEILPTPPIGARDKPFLTAAFEWSEYPFSKRFEEMSQMIFDQMNRDTETNKENSVYFQYLQALIEFKTSFQQVLSNEATVGRLSKADVYFDAVKNEWMIAKGAVRSSFLVSGDYIGQMKDGKPHGYGVVKLDGKPFTYFGYFEAGLVLSQGLIVFDLVDRPKVAFGYVNVGQFAIWDQEKLEMIQFNDTWNSLIQIAGEHTDRPILKTEERVKEQGLLMLSALAYAELPQSMINQDVSTILSKLATKEKQKLTTVAYRDSSFTKWLENIRLVRIIDERDYFQKRTKVKLGQTGLYALVFERSNSTTIAPTAKDLIVSFRGTRIGSKGFNHAVTEKDWREISKQLSTSLFMDIKAKLLGDASSRSWIDRKIQLTGYSAGGLLAQGLATAMLEQGVQSDQMHLVTFNGIGMKRNWLSVMNQKNGFEPYRNLGTNWLVEGEWSAKNLDYDDRVGLTRVIPNAIYESVEESLKNTLGPNFYHSIDRFFEFYNAGLVDRSVVDFPIDWMKTTSTSLSVKGTKASEYLTGTPWSDRIFGLDGADQLNGGEGGNYIDAGNGSDQVIVNALLSEITEPPTKSNRCYSLNLVSGNGVCDHVLLGNDQETDVLMILSGNVFLDQTKAQDRVIIEQSKFGAGIQVKYDKKADRLSVEYRANGRSGKLWISRWRTVAKGAENEAYLRFLDNQKHADVTIGELNQAVKSTKIVTIKLNFIE